MPDPTTNGGGPAPAKPRRVVFYSWQSDLPNATNRGLILRALEDGAKLVGTDAQLGVQPVIDRDTKGVPGSPDIAKTILDKIDASDVFAADISLVNSPRSKRRTPNPNVLFELGYAFGTLGEDKIILVFNEAFGRIRDLPFDLRQRRMVKYRAAPRDQNRAASRKELAAAFRDAIQQRLMVEIPSRTLDILAWGKRVTRVPGGGSPPVLCVPLQLRNQGTSLNTIDDLRIEGSLEPSGSATAGRVLLPSQEVGWITNRNGERHKMPLHAGPGERQPFTVFWKIPIETWNQIPGGTNTIRVKLSAMDTFEKGVESTHEFSFEKKVWDPGYDEPRS